jgi:hypothetical protein
MTTVTVTRPIVRQKPSPAPTKSSRSASAPTVSKRECKRLETFAKDMSAGGLAFGAMTMVTATICFTVADRYISAPVWRNLVIAAPALTSAACAVFFATKARQAERKLEALKAPPDLEAGNLEIQRDINTAVLIGRDSASVSVTDSDSDSKVSLSEIDSSEGSEGSDDSA